MLKLYFFNVGHGDSIAIHFPNDEWGIVDCKRPLEKKEPSVLRFLKNRPIHSINFVCVTHPHSDHIKGLDALSEYYKDKIQQILIFGIKTGSPSEKDAGKPLVKTLFTITNDCKKCEKVNKVLRGQQFSIGGVEVLILNPTEKIKTKFQLKSYTTEALEFNEESVVMLLRYAGKEILLTGDIPLNIWKEIEEEYSLSADIIKISHHGSGYNNNNEHLARIVKNRAIAVISTDGGRRWKNVPDGEIIRFLREDLNCEVLLTNELMNSETSSEKQEEDLLVNDVVDMLSKKLTEPIPSGYYEISITPDGKILKPERTL